MMKNYIFCPVCRARLSRMDRPGADVYECRKCRAKVQRFSDENVFWAMIELAKRKAGREISRRVARTIMRN